MGYYPVMLDLGGRSVVVVGTGFEAQAKIEGLLAAGAVIEVFDPVLEGPVAGLVGDRVVYTPRLPRPEELGARALVIAAHRDMDINRHVARMASRLGVTLNVVDQPALSTCIMVSQLRRGDLVIGVSTSGQAPGLSRRIRLALESLFDDQWDQRLKVFVERRTAIRDRYPADARRSRIRVEEERIMQEWNAMRR